MPRTQLIAALPGVEVAITQMGPFTERVLDAAPDLRFLVCCRGGPVNVQRAGGNQARRHRLLDPRTQRVAAAEHAVT